MMSTLFFLLLPLTTALTSSETRSRFVQAFSSPSGKLAFSPEVIIPEPSDATALLLQTTAIQTLSGRIRACKANAAFIKSSLPALQTFCVEQESARGNFPGPVPVVYCGSDDGGHEASAVAQAGADGIMIQACGGQEIQNVDDLLSQDHSAWISACKHAWECGLQPIPEIIVGEEVAAQWEEEDVSVLIKTILDALGVEPIAIVLTINPVDSEQEEPIRLPKVPNTLSKTLPVLGSVRTVAGENRIGIETARFKDSGFAGALLRSYCVPGFRVQLDLELVGKFWEACINDLKSTRSKSFSFRSKNNLEQDLGQKWASLRKSVLDSGALGDPNDFASVADEGAGDYQGFA